MTDKAHIIEATGETLKMAREIAQLNVILGQGNRGLAVMQHDRIERAFAYINANNISDARKELMEAMRLFAEAAIVLGAVEDKMLALSAKCNDQLRETVEDNQIAHGVGAEDAAAALKKVMGK